MIDLTPNNSESPLVSIVIPVFNQAQFLQEAVESVINQTFQNWELIIVDDGSTDLSSEIAQSLVNKYQKKLYFFKHDINYGASAARNLGIQKAKGKYLTFLDSDDVFFKDTLEKELRAFEQNPDADGVCGTLECWYSWSDESTTWERDFTINLMLETDKIYQPPSLLIHNLKAGGRKPGVDSLMLKTEFAKKSGVFSESLNFSWEDQIFWSKVSLHGKIFVMNDCLAKYRQHPASTCAVTMKSGDDFSSIRIFVNWLENYLREQYVINEELLHSLEKFKKSIRLQTKLKTLKHFYRRILPLSVRYKLRDKLTFLKRFH